MQIENKSSYQFPGVTSKPSLQHLFYTDDVSKLNQSCDDPHFLWNDIQLSKGQLNKDRLINVEINGKSEEVYYRSAPCQGVKYCPTDECTHIVPIRDKRKCPEHNTALERTYSCPVEFVYIHPKDSGDRRRWIGAVVRCQKSPTENFHNHKIHAANKIAQCVRERIGQAISANPSLTQSDIACGNGLGFIPSAVDGASSHSGKVSQEIKKTKQKRGLLDRNWSPMNFEEVADSVDTEDNELGEGDNEEYRKHGRPYLIASGMEEGIKYIFTMSPMMAKVASEADFLQCDITYDDCKDYPYIFNAVAFDKVSMQWIVVARIRLDTQKSDGYALCFKKIFDKCRSTNDDFELGSTLQGIVTDWSDAEINGLKIAVGKKTAEKLHKGCKVHWQRSCQRVADRVLSSRDKMRERSMFLKISSQIQALESAVKIVACFETLCSVRSVADLLNLLPTLSNHDDAKFIDENCNWSAAKHWAQWWTRSDHLKMLSKTFSTMAEDVWKRCPSSTNAVERRNKDCKSDSPQCLKLAMIKVYKLDKVACLKQKQRLKSIPDKSCQFGPPDRVDNFVQPTCSNTSSRKRANNQDSCSNTPAPKRQAIKVDNTTIQCIPNQHPEIIGKRARMKFEDEEGVGQWYEGVVSSYNTITGKYGVYFPCDGQTEEASFDDDDLEVMN